MSLGPHRMDAENCPAFYDGCHCHETACSCGFLVIGCTVTGSRNWNPDCFEHGLESVWYNSPEQRAHREAANKRSRELYAQAKAARNGTDQASSAEEVQDDVHAEAEQEERRW